MITSLVGKTFLKAYNEKYNTSYSARDFFEKKYFEIFFNHSKYMQWITNSPFVQMRLGQKVHLLQEDERREKLEALFEKAENEVADASFAIGYPASEVKEFASTSGLVSDITIETDEEEVFYSWIGSGLGVGVAGGYSILLNDPDILMHIYDGWKYYRRYLNDPALDKLKGNQINTWNGQWLTYRLSNLNNNDFTFLDLSDNDFFKITPTLIEVDTVRWTNLFFSLSSQYPEKTLSAYIYSLGQTNKTIGFIPIYLKSGRRLIDVFRELYHTEGDFSSRDFQSLFGIYFKHACELGSIGLHALRPEGLTKYYRNDNNISFNKESDIVNYKSYKTWLVAMLSKNKEQITDYTMEIAELLLRYRAVSKGTSGKNLIERELLASNSKKNFLESLVQMLDAVSEDDIDKLKKLRDNVHLMSNEDFVYFNTLLKFDYKYADKKS